MCKDFEHKKPKIIKTDPEFYTYKCFECGEVYVVYRDKPIEKPKPKKRRWFNGNS